jgi:Xaa-Pro aminopeptidase
LAHNIEKSKFGHVPGKLIPFSSYKLLEQSVASMLTGAHKIAMEYSPKGRLPYVGLVDAGTIEFVRGLGHEIVSSADLVANFQARLTVEQMASHRIAARNLIEIKNKAFGLVRESLTAGRKVNEWDVCKYMLELFEKYDMETDAGPNCSVGANAGNPHYEPTAENCAAVGANQLVLLDLWAKFDEEDAVYADITWTGYTGASIPAEIAKVFAIVAAGRDRAISFANERFAQGETVHGFEVDRAVRKVITDAGYGEFFIHRTGHSLGRAVHDVGPNIDDLETQDRRRLQESIAFTVEPGIYLPHFGIRSEINVLVQNNRAVVTTLPLQTEVACLV